MQFSLKENLIRLEHVNTYVKKDELHLYYNSIRRYKFQATSIKLCITECMLTEDQSYLVGENWKRFPTAAFVMFS